MENPTKTTNTTEEEGGNERKVKNEMKIIQEVEEILKEEGLNWSESDSEILNEIVILYKKNNPMTYLNFLQNEEKINKIISLGFLYIENGKIIPSPKGLRYVEKIQYGTPILPEVIDWYTLKKNKVGQIIGIEVFPGLLAKHINQEEKIITFWDTLEPYLYRNGVYIPAEPLLLKEIQEHIPIDFFKKSYKIETLDALKSLTGIERNRISETNNPNFINLKNGLLDLDRMELQPHTPNYFSFSQIITPWVKNATCPAFLTLLKEALPEEEDRLTLQEFLGGILLHDMRYQKALILYGESGNGKSTIINIIREVLGQKNVSTETLQNLIENRFRLANLYGKLANLCPDNPSKKIEEAGIFKAITGGDSVSAERKGINSFEFVNYATIILSANSLPPTKDATDAFFDRFIIISFLRKFRGAKNEVKNLFKIIADHEREGILNWMIEGLDRLLKQDKYTYNPSTEEIKEEYIRKSNPVAAFYLDSVEEVEGEYITKKIMYSRYVDYCKEYKMNIINDNTFAKEIIKQSGRIQATNKRNVPDSNIKRTPVWMGVQFNTQGGKGSANLPLTRNEQDTFSYGENKGYIMNGKGGKGLTKTLTCEKKKVINIKNIIEKCYVYKCNNQKGKNPLTTLTTGNNEEKTQEEVRKNENKNLCDKKDKSNSILRKLGIAPGVEKKIDFHELLERYKNNGFSEGDALTMIGEAGGIITKVNGNIVFDFSFSLNINSNMNRKGEA